MNSKEIDLEGPKVFSKQGKIGSMINIHRRKKANIVKIKTIGNIEINTTTQKGTGRDVELASSPRPAKDSEFLAIPHIGHARVEKKDVQKKNLT
ncbi:MAG: hypothetical protein EZS28_001859 [Streblomastix strix]|uniref:Uncharacterized protein n=1 Tax=Streblomastix strix TaxID=222440 RepID=A0A5J4X7V8_9EUKA|nr:MAG: hypothetical protein EZS28_001859 [Streblomastix strix]